MRLQAAMAMTKSKGLKIGDQVTVDGLMGRGAIVQVKGNRVTIRYRNGEFISRDERFVHNLKDNMYKSQYQSLQAESAMRYQGLDIIVENPKGSVRRGVNKKTGIPWETEMKYPYGEIKDSVGLDGDPVDVYVGNDPGAQFAYVVHQLKPDSGEWDEDKCMLGFPDAMEAKRAYMIHYDEPDKFFGSIDAIPMKRFKELVKKKEPIKIAGSGTSEGAVRGWDTRGRGIHPALLLPEKDGKGDGFSLANPNKTVGDWLRKNPRQIERTPGRASTPFSEWLIEQARKGMIYPTMEDAQKAFDKKDVDAGFEEVEQEDGPVRRHKPHAYIEQVGTQFCVRSRMNADTNFGCYPSREEAEANLRTLHGYGTSEGVSKEWDERGRGKKKMSRDEMLNDVARQMMQHYHEPQEVAERGGPGDVYDFIDTSKTNWRANMPHDEFDEALSRAVKLFKEKHGKKVKADGSPSQYGRTGWQYGRRSLAPSTGFLPTREAAGFPSVPRGGRGASLGRQHSGVVKAPKISRPTLSSYADFGEPMTGNMGHAHIEPVTWFHPPSLTKRLPNEETRIPTDDVREKNDKFLDVTKRNSKDTKEFRMKLLKRSAPTGRIPARTTLLEPHSATYTPGAMYSSAGKARRMKGSQGRMFTAYNRRGVI